MGNRKIITLGDETLRKVCRPVASFDGRLCRLLQDMAQTMYDAEGVGLAAPQVGILRRAVVIDVGAGLVELVNPVITEKSGEAGMPEGCLSVPNRQGFVIRPEKVIVEALDRNGQPVTITGEGLLARALCHEIDHLDGILYIDKMEHEITAEGET
jgi:peptide deformylase